MFELIFVLNPVVEAYSPADIKYFGQLFYNLLLAVGVGVSCEKSDIMN